MNPAMVIAASVLFGVACLLAVLGVVVRVARQKTARRITQRLDPADILMADKWANFLGERSRGGRQVRGNGALVLTKNELLFFRAAPFREYTIPLSAVEKVETPNSFNGKSMLAPLLVVHYRVDGRKDAMGWALKGVDAWKSAIDAILRPTAPARQDAP